MKTPHRILLLLWLSVTCSLSVTAQENQSYFLHTIEKGQSLYSIAAMYGVAQADIVKLNPGSDVQIYAGRQLRIPRTTENSRKETYHTIVAGETLYRLTVNYGVTARDILEANPGLSAENFRRGQVVRIPQTAPLYPPKGGTGPTNLPKGEAIISSPFGGVEGAVGEVGGASISPAVESRCREMHKVKKKETIYSISRQYGITQAELLAANPELQGKSDIKKGSLLCIPQTAPLYPPKGGTGPTNLPKGEAIISSPFGGVEGAVGEVGGAAREQGNEELFRENRKASSRIATVKAAVVLPFLGVSPSESARMVEYYEGLLMAVDSLKRLGTSIDLYTYNTGPEDSSLTPLLERSEMKEMDIIFGPLYQQHIHPLAEFAKQHDIRLVIPFTSRDNTVFRNPAVFQVNTPQSYLYSEVYDHFARQFPNAHVIFVEATSGTKEKAEFVKGLKTELKNRAIPMQSVKEDASAETLRTLLHPERENIFIPTSGSSLTLIRLLPQLTMLRRELPDSRIHLFGYPEWQTYTRDHLEAFFELDTYFYSSFYTNNLLPAAVGFTKSYRRWYGKEMDDRYPKYAMLGFDTAFFFLRALSRYGSSFEQQMHELDLTPIQTGFKFQRVNNWGGFINRKVFFVHFTRDFELLKLDFD